MTWKKWTENKFISQEWKGSQSPRKEQLEIRHEICMLFLQLVKYLEMGLADVDDAPSV